MVGSGLKLDLFGRSVIVRSNGDRPTLSDRRTMRSPQRSRKLRPLCQRFGDGAKSARLTDLIPGRRKLADHPTPEHRDATDEECDAADDPNGEPVSRNDKPLRTAP